MRNNGVREGAAGRSVAAASPIQTCASIRQHDANVLDEPYARENRLPEAETGKESTVLMEGANLPSQDRSEPQSGSTARKYSTGLMLGSTGDQKPRQVRIVYPSRGRREWVPESKAGKSGVAASAAAINAKACRVGLALLHQVLGCIAAVVHVHHTPLAS